MRFFETLRFEGVSLGLFCIRQLFRAAVLLFVFYPVAAQVISSSFAGMSIPFIVPASGPLPEGKVCISQKSGEILWPIRHIYDIAYGDSSIRHCL